MNQSEFEQRLAGILVTTMQAVAAGIAPVSPKVDAAPKGLEAVVLSATLRAYADVIEEGFGEGNKMGPLKTSVDEIRARALQLFRASKG